MRKNIQLPSIKNNYFFYFIVSLFLLFNQQINASVKKETIVRPHIGVDISYLNANLFTNTEGLENSFTTLGVILGLTSDSGIGVEMHVSNSLSQGSGIYNNATFQSDMRKIDFYFTKIYDKGSDSVDLDYFLGFGLSFIEVGTTAIIDNLTTTNSVGPSFMAGFSYNIDDNIELRPYLKTTISEILGTTSFTTSVGISFLVKK